MKAKHTGNIIIVLQKPYIRDNILNNKILLGFKPSKIKSDKIRTRKRVGAGKWTPPGGGSEDSDKSQKHAAQRELFDKTHLWLPIGDFHKRGILKGYIGQNELLWLVHIYLVFIDNGQRPIHNDEYTDIRWFSIEDIPWNQMLPGDRYWLPQIINGQKITTRLFFDGDTDNLKDYEISLIPFSRV